tara:strand:+ start:759 stop:1625 length:867 start_codon:yes stop_codon:yes gene_type:complete
MALIKCVECGQEYSDKAEACPKCACPTTAQITKEKVEEVKPEVTEKNQLKPEEKIRVGNKYLLGLAALGITAIGIIATGLTAVVLIINSSRETIYKTQADAMEACDEWAQNQYESEELVVYAKENNLPLDEIDYDGVKRSLHITNFLCTNDNSSKHVEAQGGISHYESFGSSGNAAERAEERVRELRDELGIDPFWISIYRPYKPGFDPERCENATGFDTENNREDPSKTYCPQEIYSSHLEGKGGWNGEFVGKELYVRKNNLTAEDIFIYWKVGNYDSEPVKVFPYY